MARPGLEFADDTVQTSAHKISEELSLETLFTLGLVQSMVCRCAVTFQIQMRFFVLSVIFVLRSCTALFCHLIGLCCCFSIKLFLHDIEISFAKYVVLFNLTDLRFPVLTTVLFFIYIC